MIIGLVGRARNGKTTVADAIVASAKYRGLDAKIYDIGSLVRIDCIKNNLIPDKSREDLTKEELGVLVKWGYTMRENEPDYWLSQLSGAIGADNLDVAVIPNIRYRNEAGWVTTNSGALIKVISLNPDGSPFISQDRDANHPSETELRDYNADYYLTVRRGDPALLAELAAATFERVWRLRLN